MDPAQARPQRRSLALWALSLIGATVLLGLASTKLPLWPSTLVLARPELWWLAVGLHVPYALVRALRLRYVLDPLVEQATGGAQTRVSPALLYGSGLVGFFVVILLPLRLGELSRPLMLARGREPGVGVPESIGAVAVERVVDGLMVVGLLFFGLALARPLEPTPHVFAGLEFVRGLGEVMAWVFGFALLALAVGGLAPERVVAGTRRLVGWVSRAAGDALARLVERVLHALAPLHAPRRGLSLLAWSLLYWAITVGQLWLVLHACGLALGVAEAAAIVAIVGLSIQLPGGPAQAGSFQLGVVAALELFSPAGPIGVAGSTFAVLMYLLQVAGAGVLALPGLWLLARHAGRVPANT